MALEGGFVMAPRNWVDGRDAAVLVRETRQDRIGREKAERKVADREAAIVANRKHVAATGKVMPQGGRHRKRNRGDS